MRLLEVNGNGQLSLTQDIINNTIPYAILSHTWGDDGDEVNFKDLTDDSWRTKAGHRKLRFCGEQATRDGLQHFWVDTCCIDKSNNAELSEAINSMFRWYRNAAKCYVYLTDVSTNDPDKIDPSLQSWEAAFRSSRWFTRGWTLQELIAPQSVEFFCSNNKRLGDKKSLERQLHEITGIAVSALQGTPLSEFSFDERMAWAKNRETKREEDKAYSLLGIFDIYIPLIYGEGTKNALYRLQDEFHKRSNKRQLDELSTPQIQSSTIPFRRDPNFIVRQTLLDQLHEKCATLASRTALVGFGGVGYVGISHTHTLISNANLCEESHSSLLNTPTESDASHRRLGFSG
jgi:hypothetical protein